MENINKLGIIIQPGCYNDFGVPEFIVEELYEENEYIHIKGDVGYLDKKLKKINNGELKMKISDYDGTAFYFKYDKKKHIIEVARDFRKVSCDNQEFNKFAHTWTYDDPSYDNDTHFPYFRLIRSKDCILIPHFVKALWKDNDTLKIFIKTAKNE